MPIINLSSAPASLASLHSSSDSSSSSNMNSHRRIWRRRTLSRSQSIHVIFAMPEKGTLKYIVELLEQFVRLTWLTLAGQWDGPVDLYELFFFLVRSNACALYGAVYYITSSNHNIQQPVYPHNRHISHLNTEISKARNWHRHLGKQSIPGIGVP
jgi:hypothetical protein